MKLTAVGHLARFQVQLLGRRRGHQHDFGVPGVVGILGIEDSVRGDGQLHLVLAKDVERRRILELEGLVDGKAVVPDVVGVEEVRGNVPGKTKKHQTQIFSEKKTVKRLILSKKTWVVSKMKWGQKNEVIFVQ